MIGRSLGGDELVCLSLPDSLYPLRGMGMANNGVEEPS